MTLNSNNNNGDDDDDIFIINNDDDDVVCGGTELTHFFGLTIFYYVREKPTCLMLKTHVYEWIIDIIATCLLWVR